MCLVNFHFLDHPKYKFIVASNRDEFYERPTATAHFWEDQPMILAGRDLEQKGTWLGITKDGRFGALTNIRKPEEQDTYSTSRGEIVTNFLTGKDAPGKFLQNLAKVSSNYAGFNVIVGNGEQLLYFNNIEKNIVEITPGTHSLSNRFLNTPWPKVVKGRENLRHYVLNHKLIDHDELFKIVADAELAEEDQLPNTGIPIELERQLSSLFIQTDGYGTRSSTVLTIDHENNVKFTERTFNKGVFSSDKTFNFKIM